MGRTRKIKEDADWTTIMGYVLNGKYYKDKPDMMKLQSRQSSMYKQHEHDRQRKDYAREIIQPYDRSGQPNQDFIDAYPNESKEYGFLPKDEDLKNL